MVVDRADPAFQNPTKPIGPFYSEEQARALEQSKGYTMKEDSGRGWRRVVPSPKPRRIVEIGTIRTLWDTTVSIACGGGAMIDLGAHPMYLLCALLGEPVSVKSTFTQMSGRGVEDNAVSLLEFENGAIGVSETGFMSVGYPFTIELGGTKGALLMRNQNVCWCCEETGNQWVDVAELPEKRPSPLAQWAMAEKPEDISPDFNIEVAVRLTRVMEAAYK